MGTSGFRSTLSLLKQNRLPWWLGSKESLCQYRRCKRHGFDAWVWKIPGEGNGNPLQYSCLGNAMDRGAWWATIHGVSKSWTQLSPHAHIANLN